jgi:hypothetical protein
MKINLRWFVQALALVSGIYFFKQLFERSKELLISFSANALLVWFGFLLLFVFCFLLLMFTSYLKEQGGNTLKNRIAFFERIVHLLRLDEFREHRVLEGRRHEGESAMLDPKIGDGKADKSL